MGKHGGARPGAGRWSKAELAAIAAGDTDEAVAMISGRPIDAIQRKRQEMIAAGVAIGAKAAEAAPADRVAAEPKAPKVAIGIRQALRFIEQSKALARAKNRGPEFDPFRLPQFPPKAMPPKDLQMAMDEGISWASNQWAGDVIGSISAEGLQFLGYPFLSELALRPEYRVISETIADDATRKWIDFDVSGGEADEDRRKEKEDEDQAALRGKPVSADERKGRREDRVKKAGKSDMIKELHDDQARLELRDHMYTICRDDGFFGRSHLFLNFGVDLDGAGDKELMTSVGNGRDKISASKVKKGSFESVKPIEAAWSYPTTYNAQNPLKYDWYNPQVWYVMGKQLHLSRLPTFIGHVVPDLLKPAFSFGGLSLSQMAKPYVDIWLTTRESVGALIHSFSVMVLMTDMQTILQSGGGAEGVLSRVAMFNALRDNQGTFVLNKATEDFKNVSASLAGLHELQAQAQEHMMSVVRIPDIKFTGINPSGLNASTDGTMRAYYDTITAYQNRFMRPNLTRVVNFQQLSLFGKVDQEIIFDFEPLWEMSKKEEAELQKMDAERHQIYVDMGAFAPVEVRGIAIANPKLPYGDLDPDDVPDLREEEEAGLEPEGGRPQPLGEAGPGLGESPDKAAAPGGGDSNVIPFQDQAAGTRTRSPITTSGQAADAEFKESDHPRAPDGKFGSSGGSSGLGKIALKAGGSEHGDALADYLQDPSINDYMRTGQVPATSTYTPAEMKKTIARLDAAIAERKTDAPLTLYRGFGSKNPKDFTNKSGIIRDKAFVSTSPDEAAARKFSEDNYIAKIELPAGSNALSVDYDVEDDPAASAHTAQMEVILPRGISLEVVGVNHATKTVTLKPKELGTAKSATTKPQEPAGELDPARLTKVGAQMGSNPGGVYAAPDGKKYYVKKGKSPDHVKNELIAASLYDLAGAPTLNYRPVKGGGHIATEMAKLDKDNASKLSPAEIKAAQADFVAHAWLANWDAVGLGGDNLGVVAGKATPLDMGGALSYRAQGAPKGAHFGNQVGEINTLRDKNMNRDSARVFGSMTEEQLRDSAQRVTEIPDEDVRDTVLAGGGDKALADKLVARKHDIAKRFGLATDSEFKEDDHPRAPDGKFGKGGASGKKTEMPGLPGFLKREPQSEGGGAPGERQSFRMPQYGLTHPPSSHLDFFKDVKLTPEQEAERAKAKAERAAKIEADRQERLPKSSGDPQSPEGTVVFATSPGAPMPTVELNGIPFAPWMPPTDWAEVEGQADIEEPELEVPEHKEAASGVIIRELDGRVWLMQPKGGFGGYDSTFPKGRAEEGLSLQANAIKEAWEETGLKVRIKAIAGDYEGDTTMTRYYMAEREGGTPQDASWEAQSVALLPAAELGKALNRKRDRAVAGEHAGMPKGAHDEANFEEGKHPRDADGKFSSTGGGESSEPDPESKAGFALKHAIKVVGSGIDPVKTPDKFWNNMTTEETEALINHYGTGKAVQEALAKSPAKPDGLKHYKSPSSPQEFMKAAQAMIDKPAQKSSTFRWQLNNLIKEAPNFFEHPDEDFAKNVVASLKLKIAESWDKERQAALAKGDGDLADKIATKMAKLGWSFVEGANKPAASEPDKKLATQVNVAKQAAAAVAVKEKPTAAEIEKAKKNVALKLQYVPGAPSDSPAAQKLVDKFNEKWAGKEIAGQPEKLKEKVEDFKDMQAAMVPLMSAQQQAAAKAQAEQQKQAQQNAAKQAETLKAEAEQAKQKNAHVMKELGITESEAEGFNALVEMLGGKQADVIQKFKSYEDKAKGYGYPITGFQTALISNYSDGGYGGINAALRSGSWTVAQHVYAKLMNKALQSMPKYTGVAKRGTSLPHNEQAKYKVGHVVQEHGFTSSSPTKPWSGNTQYTITAIGKRGAHIKKLSSHPGEDEVVFSARTYFKVTKVDGSPGGNMHIHMEELEHDV